MPPKSKKPPIHQVDEVERAALESDSYQIDGFNDFSGGQISTHETVSVDQPTSEQKKRKTYWITIYQPKKIERTLPPYGKTDENHIGVEFHTSDNKIRFIICMRAKGDLWIFRYYIGKEEWISSRIWEKIDGLMKNISAEKTSISSEFGALAYENLMKTLECLRVVDVGGKNFLQYSVSMNPKNTRSIGGTTIDSSPQDVVVYDEGGDDDVVEDQIHDDPLMVTSQRIVKDVIPPEGKDKDSTKKRKLDEKVDQNKKGNKTPDITDEMIMAHLEKKLDSFKKMVLAMETSMNGIKKILQFNGGKCDD